MRDRKHTISVSQELHLIGGKEAIYEGSNCDNLLRSPTTESIDLAAAIFPVETSVENRHRER